MGSDFLVRFWLRSMPPAGDLALIFGPDNESYLRDKGALLSHDQVMARGGGHRGCCTPARSSAGPYPARGGRGVRAAVKAAACGDGG